MKKRIVGASIAFLAITLSAQFLRAEGENFSPSAVQQEFKLRVLEGLREEAEEPAKVVTSSYLRYMLSADFQSREEADEIAQIRKTFNLKDVKLLTEADLSWKNGPAEKVSHSFRLDGRTYLVRLSGGNKAVKTGERSKAGRRYGIEVFELSGPDKTSLLETEFSVNDLKNVAVFGFEDSQGKPYFISLSRAQAVAGGVVGGVVGGVEGGVEGGVVGGVQGGVEGAVVGGVQGGVKGSLQSEEVEKKRQEFERGAASSKDGITPPKLVKKVNPVYPEEARKRGIQGTVIIEAKIDEAGRVIDTLVLRSVPELDQAAVDALRQWVYEPMVISGKPVKAVFAVTVRFKFDEKDIEEFAAGAVKVKDQIKPPKPVKIVDPVYPESARQSKVEGVVILQARTDAEGRVKDVMILRSVPLLDQAAIEAVKQWTYEPLIIDGQAREAVFTVTVRFDLSGEKKVEVKPIDTGEIITPKLITKVNPVYPEAARQARVQGLVLLEATIDEKGNVVKVKVLKSIPELDQAAIDALKQWKYEPVIIEGKPKGVVFTVTINFVLH